MAGGSRDTSPSREEIGPASPASEKRDAFIRDSAGGQVQNSESLAVRSPLSRAIRFHDEDASREQISTRSSFQGERDRNDGIVHLVHKQRGMEEV